MGVRGASGKGRGVQGWPGTRGFCQVSHNIRTKSPLQWDSQKPGHREQGHGEGRHGAQPHSPAQLGKILITMVMQLMGKCGYRDAIQSYYCPSSQRKLRHSHGDRLSYDHLAKQLHHKEEASSL